MSKEFDQCTNSCADPLPNKEPQAPSSIPVDKVDDGNHPFANEGYGPNGAGSSKAPTEESL